MNTWSTIVIGVVVGILWKRFSAEHRSGTFTDMLLGITGGFAARWLLDVLGEASLNSRSLGVVATLTGAGLLLWCFNGLDRKPRRFPQARPSVISTPGSPIPKSSSDSPNSSVRAA